jgi:hypothetical protein
MAAMSSYNSNKNNSNNRSQNQQQPKPAFAQPAFRQAAHQQNKPKPKQQSSQQPIQSSSQALDENGRKIVTGGDSSIGIAHRQRVKTAGRVGTKRYVNPCKVFTGNLPFSYTKTDLSSWICEQMGMPEHILLNECKIVSDWKTGVSKGFGFCVFTEAVYATVCIDKCHNLMLEGRAVTVKQGVKKAVDNVLYVKKNNNNVSQNPEEDAITSGINDASDIDSDSDSVSDDGSTAKSRRERRRREQEERLDPYQEAIVRKLDPDLVDDALDDNALFFEFANKNIDEDDDDVDDFDGDYDDSDDGVDGIWIENSGPVVSADEAMNRQNRRESAKRQKRKKLPSKGFGN